MLLIYRLYMKIFRLGYKFYIFFTLITLIPATWLAQFLQAALQRTSLSLINQFANWGLIEAPTTVVIIGALFLLYELCLWKIWPIKYIHGVPNINGRYDCEGDSSFKNKKHKAFLEIKQTLLNISINLYPEETSSSYSIIANIGKNEHGNWALLYIYRNDPKIVTGDLDMRSHIGCANLEIFNDERQLKGRYFNDGRERSTFGSLSCSFVSKKIIGHY